MTGWVKLRRKMLDWEWYSDPAVCRLFTHLLLMANYKDTKWRGQVIKKGELLTGRKLLSEQTGLSEQQIRTALSKLQSTGEITSRSTNRFSVITITQWELYQADDREATSNTTNKQPTSNQQATTSKNINNIKNIKNIYIDQNVSDEIWQAFFEHRKRKKAPVTELAMQGIAREAKKANWPLEDALRELCERNWTGFKANWVEKKKPTNKNGYMENYEFAS
jgi:hypothetical protein